MERPPVLMLTIELSSRQYDILEVSVQDDLQSVIEAFCQQHSLPVRVQTPMHEFIKEQLDQLSSSNTCMAHTKINIRSFAASRTRSHTSENHSLGYCDLSAVKKRMQRDKLKLFRLHQNTTCTNRNTTCTTKRAEALMKSGVERELRLQQKRLQKQKEELALCTFAPSIKKYRLVEMKTAIQKSEETAERLYDTLVKKPSELAGLKSQLLAPLLNSLPPHTSFPEFKEGFEYFCKFLTPDDLKTVCES